MIAVFLREREVIHLLAETAEECGISPCFRAGNNVDSTSKGIWPPGMYDMEVMVKVDGPESLPSGKYGPWFFKFKQFQQEDSVIRFSMGIHSGRAGMKDGRGREGYQHCTFGCIRTETAATEYMAERWDKDPLTMLWVK